ncbi:MAG: hypothetical protein HQK55_13255 [Deltaproteobacteria bacterium]|nr:hypothetical protein [Deltaproteobacteria bacterium]
MKITKMAAIVLAFSLWVGCASNDVNKGVGVPLNTVNFLDKALEEKVAVQSTNARRSASDTVEVWAVLRNKTDKTLQLEARTQFFDRQQAPGEPPTAWQRLFLPSGALGTYKDFSTKVSEVGYYYIEIREVR